MSRRWLWTLLFLGATGVVLGAELWAAADGNPDTRTWTEHVVTYLPWEITAALIGALLLWLPLHFAVRYMRKAKESRTDPVE